MTTETREPNSLVQSAGRTPSIAAMDAVALYDPRNGKIVHMHHVITFEGMARRTRAEQEQSALESARRLGRKVDGLHMLHISDFHPTGKPYRVDLKKQILVEEPLVLPRGHGKPQPRRDSAHAKRKTQKKK